MIKYLASISLLPKFKTTIARNGKLACASALLSLCALQAQATTVQFQTSLGDFEVNLYDEHTPITVENFLAYVNAGSYTDSIIHRSVDNFIVQGGGYTWEQDENPARIETNPAILNEPVYSNVAGTIAMAKTGNNVNSATSQWFFNLKDNGANLDIQNGGFTVFGHTDAAGLAILESISDLPVYSFQNSFESMPLMDYTTDDANNQVPVEYEHAVKIYAITVLDATVDTLGNETPVENDRIDSYEPPSSSNGGSGGGSLTLLGLLGLACLGLVRRKRTPR